MKGKIALEEHYENPAFPVIGERAITVRGGYTEVLTDPYMAECTEGLHNAAKKLEDMDKSGIEIAIVSLTMPGIEGIPDAAKAVKVAMEQNDYAYKTYVEPHRGRFLAFACDPKAADELERAVTQLGFKGALVNGYSNIGDEQTARYLDEPPVLPFWERAAALDVPVYLHPRIPLSSQMRALQDYEGIQDSAWGFGRETAEHALRLILSGLFDRFSTLTVILGHMGEGLPFTLPAWNTASATIGPTPKERTNSP
jgi:predicted TIM-barrel fold metal-dependent hydrolase